MRGRSRVGVGNEHLSEDYVLCTRLAFGRVEAQSHPSLSTALSANCLPLLHRSLPELDGPCMYEVTNRRDAEAIYGGLRLDPVL